MNDERPPRFLIAAVATVRFFERIGAAWFWSKTQECIVYDPRWVRMVRRNGSKIVVVPKNGGEL